ncbi:hypothetical protein IHQ71_29840 (plasmid) [Rhizobium sp. TH2]|uniref:hypothetical protein n=1 Tax=Rhizobium sp. TH2 TaxID=2775403 RepID=UPI0021578C91|nr:hypothetical protein [Rhizobium sp. TH2]UVC12236.1 hypothetical protein IHQ71_29840 [Rhizobium sp. TH2]
MIVALRGTQSASDADRSLSVIADRRKSMKPPFSADDRPSAVSEAKLTSTPLDQALCVLLNDEIARTLSIETFVEMLSTGTAGLASLANAKAVAEGRLLEKAIAVIAASNPALKILTQIRLPIRDAALELIEQNDPALYSHIAMEANERTRRTYTVDIILVDLEKQIAYLVDVKRSLASFEAARIVELRQRMLAAALVTADILWREHKRLSVREVRVVILEASGRRTDYDHGVWAFDALDHLVGVTGAAAMIDRLRSAFATRVEANLEQALDRVVATRIASRSASERSDYLDPRDRRQRSGNDGEEGCGGTITDPQAQSCTPAIGIAPRPPVH